MLKPVGWKFVVLLSRDSFFFTFAISEKQHFASTFRKEKRSIDLGNGFDFSRIPLFLFLLRHIDCPYLLADAQAYDRKQSEHPEPSQAR